MSLHLDLLSAASPRNLCAGRGTLRTLASLLIAATVVTLTACAPIHAQESDADPAEQKPGEQKPGEQKPGEQKPGQQKPGPPTSRHRDFRHTEGYACIIFPAILNP